MDFDSLISVAAGYSDQAKAEAQVKRYTTEVKPAKKPPKSSVQSDAVKAFLRKKEVEGQKRREEALKEKGKLLELRAAAKHNRRASNMARRTKDNDFGINFNRLLQEKQEKELADAVAAAVGANPDSPIVEKKRRRRRKLLSDEMLEHDLGADRMLTLKEENRDVRNGVSHLSDHRHSESSSYRFARESTSVSHASSTPAPTRGIKRAAPPPPPDFFSLLKIAKTKQFEPVDIPVKKKIPAEEERPMTKEEKERYRDEKAYLAAKLARQNQKNTAKTSSTVQSDNSHRPNTGGSFKIPKNKPASYDPPPSRNQNANSDTRPRSSLSSKSPTLVQQNIANQLGAKVTKFPSSFNNKPPSDVAKRKSHHEEPPHRSSTANGLSRTDTSKPNKSSSGPPDAGRHSSSKDHSHTKGPTHSKSPSVSSKSDASERLQANKLPSKQVTSRPSMGSGGAPDSGKTFKNSASRPVTAKDSDRPALGKSRSELSSRPPASLGRNNGAPRPSDAKGRIDTPARPPTSRLDSAERKDVQLKPKIAVKPSNIPPQTGRKEVSAKSQPLQESRKSSQGQDIRRPSSGQEVRKTPSGLDARKPLPGQEVRKGPFGQPARKVMPGQEVRRVPPGQEVRKAAPPQEIRRAAPGQEMRRVAAPTQESRRMPPGQEMRRGPASQDVRRGPPGQEARRVPPGQEARRVPPGQDMRRPPPKQEIRQLPPSQELRRLPSGQVVRRALPPSRLPPITRNPQSFKRRIESDDEDEEMDDFIDDGPVDGPGEDVSKYIREIFGYDKRRFVDEPDDDDIMETSFAQQMKEEARSTRLGLLEDLEDIRKEQELKAKKKKS